MTPSFKILKMLKKILLLNFIFLLFIGCSSDESSGNSQYNSVWEQKTEMLTNWADNFIIPGYQELYSKLLELQVAKNDFISETSQQNLDIIRSKWLEAYKLWQKVEMFNIGPAEQSFYNNKMNIYPTNSTKIELNVQSGNYDLEDASNFSSQGFPCLDYLLHGIQSTDSSIISLYNENENYKNYLSNITNQLVSNTLYIKEQWVTYRSSFVNSTENTATSSANKMTNDFIYYYEKGFRSNKFGIPGGVFSNNPFPEKVEAYYNQNISKLLANEAFDAIKNFFSGNGGYSLEDFIDNYATGDQTNLSSEIKSQFYAVDDMIAELDQNFHNQIQEDLIKFLSTYDAIQQGTILLKTDMLSILQIATDYIDADGD